MPPSKNRLRIACPAGFGALAITVSPPPVTAPSTIAIFELFVEVRHERREVGDERVVVERRQERRAEKSGVSDRLASTGAIHQPCSPPWMTRPARKNPTSSGGLRSMRLW